MSHSYPGRELNLFSQANRWKAYVATQLRPFVAGHVLEVGAGIGSTTRSLISPRCLAWTCLEPDDHLARELMQGLRGLGIVPPPRVVVGTLDAVADQRFDCILYVDVLEHIAADRLELQRATDRLRPGGRLVAVAPAHSWLTSPFDLAVGHLRRYSRRQLTDLAPANLTLNRAFYVDSAGILASWANRVLLRATQPTLAQIRFWDGALVGVSRWLDPLTGYRVGKTVIGIWTRH